MRDLVYRREMPPAATLAPATTLHVLNGDVVRAVFGRSGLGGAAVAWTDVLHEGPVRAEVGTAETRRVRAEYLSAAGYGSREDLAAGLLAQDEALARWFDYDEIVFWLEHDLFDQLLLIRHLAWLSGSLGAASRSRLIVAGDYLGPLSPEQLAALWPTAQHVTVEQITAGTHAWEAFTADEPHHLARAVDEGVAGSLPFLHAALERLLEEYPSIEGGLGRSERQMLTVVDEGHETLASAFVACQGMETRIFMGDATFLQIARRLASALHPPLELTPIAGRDRLAVRAKLTPVGRAFLAGEADYVRLNGLDRWIGGVYLSGFGPTWRWTGSTIVVADTALA